MKQILKIYLPLFSALLFTNACEVFIKNPEIDDFCSIVPKGWTCEVIQENFDPNEIPKNAGQPIAIIKYFNSEKTFTVAETKIHPSLILDFYRIDKKQELTEYIRSQQIFSWCIPEYFGETDRYFIITSPCFKNSGIFTVEANQSITDLLETLDEIIIHKNYD